MLGACTVSYQQRVANLSARLQLAGRVWWCVGGTAAPGEQIRAEIIRKLDYQMVRLQVGASTPTIPTCCPNCINDHHYTSSC